MDTDGSFAGGVKMATHLHLEPRLRMCWATPPLPQYFFTVWYLVKHRNNFAFTFYTHYKYNLSQSCQFVHGTYLQETNTVPDTRISRLLLQRQWKAKCRRWTLKKVVGTVTTALEEVREECILFTLQSKRKRGLLFPSFNKYCTLYLFNPSFLIL